MIVAVMAFCASFAGQPTDSCAWYVDTVNASAAKSSCNRNLDRIEYDDSIYFDATSYLASRGEDDANVILIGHCVNQSDLFQFKSRNRIYSSNQL